MQRDLWNNYSFAFQDCHVGNHHLVKNLWIGGWTRGADLRGFHVIDLAGSQAGGYEIGGVFAETAALVGGSLSWLSLPIRDFAVPAYALEVWLCLAREIRQTDEPVLVVCDGGHGRSGTVAAILAFLLAPDVVGHDPVTWIRRQYCPLAVETDGQDEYVMRMSHDATNCPLLD